MRVAYDGPLATHKEHPMTSPGNYRRRRRLNVAHVQPLEARTLLSGTWATQDTLPSSNEGVGTMAADRFGNVYAAGDVIDSSGHDVWVVREKPGGSSTWATVANFGTNVYWLNGLSTDANGDVFFTARPVSSSQHWTTWELVQGSGNPVEIDDAGNGVAEASATDAAGNVYVAGKLPATAKPNAPLVWGVRKGVFNSTTGKWSFATVDLTTSATQANAIAVASVGASTTVFAAGINLGSSATWVVRKSTNGGAWATVDSFKYDSTGGNSQARAIAADSAGDVYVVGFALDGTLTGYTKNKTPIYSRTGHWIVRKSGDDGSSWGTVDDYQAPGGQDAEAVAVDAAGNAYVAGDSFDNSGNAYGIVRTNAGGTWSDADYFNGAAGLGAQYFAVAVDASGNHYAGGNDDDFDWVIRSDAPAATAMMANATASAVFSATLVKSSSSPADSPWECDGADWSRIHSAVQKFRRGLNAAL